MIEWYIFGWAFIGMLGILALMFGINYERRN